MAEGDRPADGDRSLWALNREERRLLWITFAGGLGSIVVGACIIGGALALARYLEQKNQPLWLWLVLVGLTLLVVAALVLLSFLLRSAKAAQDDLGEDMGVALAVVLIPMAALLLLVWIGIAAGVK
jgi:heme/copper-type cytochrome/quinol oxidase subunit 2